MKNVFVQSRSDLTTVAVGFSPRSKTVSACASRQRRLPYLWLAAMIQSSLTRRDSILPSHRGLKPTATIIDSLREAPSPHHCKTEIESVLHDLDRYGVRID